MTVTSFADVLRAWLTLVDLREHAIFTLRNLLHGNLENQALVNEIQPLREWDESGLLQAREHAA